jgi:GAF domain-containing protein
MMQSPARAFAEAAASLIDDDDVADTLSRLLRSCAEALQVGAVAVMVKDAFGDLQLLSSTSHRVAELELYQIQRESGPCIDSIRTAHGVTVAPGHHIARRWPDVGTRIVEAGFQSVHAAPMRWRGQALGGLNVFDRRLEPMAGDDLVMAQAFADIATVAIVHSRQLDIGEVALRVRQALEGRTVIERAKGALAYSRGVDLSTAYEMLVAMTAGRDITLSEAAAAVLEAAQRQPER